MSVVTVQFLGPVCQLQNWHRIASSSDRDAALKAHLQGAAVGALLWSFMVVCALLLYSRLSGEVSFNSIFSNMKQAGGLVAYVAYPLLFLGLVGAMISTADSAMSAIFLFVFEAARRKKRDYEPTISRSVLVGCVLFLTMFAAYVLNQTDLQGFAITVVYFLFNQLLVLFPLLLLMAVRTHLSQLDPRFRESIDSARRRIEINLTVALAAGWTVVLVMSGIGYWTGILNWTMFASVSGVLVCAASSLPAWLRVRNAWKASTVTSPGGRG